MEITIINNENLVKSPFSKEQIAGFLYQHLDQYGDKREDILRCLDYAMVSEAGKGGLVITASVEGRLAGVVVTNKTGMKGYIPENLLVYIAVDAAYRGRGIGRELMQQAVDQSEGDVALHVEPDNPARFLYEKLGFTNKYLEMRYKK